MIGMKTAKKRGYTPFFLAAAIYTAGVVAVSFWSYFQQRSNILAQEDLLLTHAAHAADHMLRDTFGGHLTDDVAAHPASLPEIRDRLNRFAVDCRFDLVGAIGFRDGTFRDVVYGSRRSAHAIADKRFISGILNSRLSSIHRMQSESTRAPILMETVHLDQHDRVRTAVSYHAITENAGYAILISRSTEQVDRLLNALVLRTAGLGIFLYTMVFPLIMLYHLARSRSARRTAELNDCLQADFIKLKERESELEDAIRDLERFNAVALGRETRIIELKAEVNALLQQMNQQKRYTIDHAG